MANLRPREALGGYLGGYLEVDGLDSGTSRGPREDIGHPILDPEIGVVGSSKSGGHR